MLVQNKLYNIELPRVGLMNGAMGTIVGAQWNDASEPILLVRFPGYTGAAIYPHDPKVIPISMEEIHAKSSFGIVRKQFPLRLAHGITCHKSQGLSLDEYVVINCRTTTGRSPTATYGWMFVACTRARHPDKIAFVGLPTVEDFVASRQQMFFYARRDFEELTDVKHDDTLWRCDIDPDEECALHQKSLVIGRDDFTAVLAQLQMRGVAELPPCTTKLLYSVERYRSQADVLLTKGTMRLPRSGYVPTVPCDFPAPHPRERKRLRPEEPEQTVEVQLHDPILMSDAEELNAARSPRSET